MRALRCYCLTITATVLFCSALAAQPPVPQWLRDINPADYALLARDLGAGMSLHGDIDATAEARGFGIRDEQGNVTQREGYLFQLTETIAVVDGDNQGYVSVWVAVLGTREEAVALARQQFGEFGMNPDWMVNGNDLGDRRIPPNGGSVAGAGKAIICFRNMVALFSWNGRLDDFADQKCRQVALLWLNKVAGPPGADLHIENGRILLKNWTNDPNVEREAAADQQYIIVQVNNNSRDVTATDVRLRVSVKLQGQAEYAPIADPARLPDIAPNGSWVSKFTWDLKGENVPAAELLFEVWSEGKQDLDPRDNQCVLPCSVYYAHNGARAFRWLEDSYGFSNYGYDGRELQELTEGLLATVIGQLQTDPKAAELLTRLMFPQTYMRFFNYLRTGLESGAGGHCYGMAATAGLYFLDPSQRPVTADTWNITRDHASANINLYQRAQMVPLAEALLTGEQYFARNWGPLNCLNAVRARLRDQRRPMVISIRGTKTVQKEVLVNGQPQMQDVEEEWGHALLAYKLLEIPGRRSVIYLYDPNLPPMLQWPSRAPMSAFGIGSDGSLAMTEDLRALYLLPDFRAKWVAAREITREVSLAEANALMPLLQGKLREMAAFLAKAEKIMGMLRCPADVVFTDPQGRRVGQLGANPVNEVPGAEIRSSGEVEIYLLPAKVPFRVTVTGTGEGRSALDLIRPGDGGSLEVVSFGGLPTTTGATFTGTLSGGQMEHLASGGTEYPPTLVGRLEGERVMVTVSTPTESTRPPVKPTGPTASTEGGTVDGAAHQLVSNTTAIRWPGEYPTTGGSVTLSFRCVEPGTILDTVGINAAKPGDFTLRQLGDDTLAWGIYHPGVQGAHRNNSGWHYLVSRAKAERGRWHEVRATWGRGGMKLFLNGREVAADPVVLALSGSPVYIGDFPGDEHWGANFNIHQGMVGEVRGIVFAP